MTPEEARAMPGAFTAFDGVQTVITFSRRPSVSCGDRLLIHAGKLRGWREWQVAWQRLFPYLGSDESYPKSMMPEGVVVGSGVIQDVVPIASLHKADLQSKYFTPEGWGFIGSYKSGDISDQLPFADFTPGRWALVIGDVLPTSNRCPRCWEDAWSCERCPLCDGKGTTDPWALRGRAGVWRVRDEDWATT